MSATKKIATVHQGGIFCQYDSSEIGQFFPEMLSPHYWQQNMAITGSAQGRGTTWFVKYQTHADTTAKHWVLRHYYRGGLIGKFNNDRYWFNTYNKTRAAKEFALLDTMQALALPCPKPIAYRIERQGLLYRADLLSSRIAQAEDLVAILSEQTITEQLWQKIGGTIKRFHQHNIYHHDLNAHNILINTQEEVFLIDFDRGEIRENNHQSWQHANIARLKRSFMKELEKLPHFHFNEDHWNALLDGYFSEKTSN